MVYGHYFVHPGSAVLRNCCSGGWISKTPVPMHGSKCRFLSSRTRDPTKFRKQRASIVRSIGPLCKFCLLSFLLYYFAYSHRICDRPRPFWSHDHGHAVGGWSWLFPAIATLQSHIKTFPWFFCDLLTTCGMTNRTTWRDLSHDNT